MKIIVAGGTGFVGQFLVPSLLKDKHRVTVLGRTKNKITQLFGNQVNAMSWEELNSKSLKPFDVIINLAGYNISDKRWNDRVKHLIIHSRVQATQRLVNTALELAEDAPRILNTSAIGIYGLHENNPQQPQPVDEAWPIPWGQPTDFLSEVAQQWEQALTPAIESGLSVAIMRFGVVLHPDFGMMKKVLPSVKLGLGSVMGSGEQGFSWIYVDDLVMAIKRLISHTELQGPFNLSSPYPVTQKVFMHTLAKAYNRPCWLKMPANVVKLLFGQMGEELLLKGQKAFPQRLFQSGFTFNYPKLDNVFYHQRELN